VNPGEEVMDRTIEKWGPFFLAMGISIALSLYGNDLVLHINAGKIAIKNLCSKLFMLFSILSVFMLGFYTFVRTSETIVLRQFRKTASSRIFMEYILFGVLLSSFAIMVSMPLLLVEPRPDSTESWWFAYIVLWAFLSSYAIFACARAAFIFAVLTRAG
jgi:hypothetical protein